MTIYQSPAACGELIEGQINGVNFLSSYTINCFSQWTLQPGQVSAIFEIKYPKLCAVIDHVAKAHLIPENWRSEITLKSNSQIPVGKGMGSSTADLSAGLSAVSDYYQLNLTPTEIMNYSIKVEATDHSAYTDATIMNHVTGDVFYQTANFFDMSVLVLEPAARVDTRKSMHEISLHQTSERAIVFERLGTELVTAYERADITWLADIAWTSALLNEAILQKPLLHSLKKLTQIKGGLGLNIAHTGSIIALWFDDSKISGEELKQQVRARDSEQYYQRLHVHQTVPGGVRRKEGSLK